MGEQTEQIATASKTRKTRPQQPQKSNPLASNFRTFRGAFLHLLPHPILAQSEPTPGNSLAGVFVWSRHLVVSFGSDQLPLGLSLSAALLWCPFAVSE